eukprot:9940418-Lingulodinium_polyedra.AAC.1
MRASSARERSRFAAASSRRSTALARDSCSRATRRSPSWTSASSACTCFASLPTRTSTRCRALALAAGSLC